MRLIGRICAMSALLGLALGGAAHTDLACPSEATVLCLEKVGYNFQICGELPGMDDQPQDFPTCFNWEEGTCTPCWFNTAAQTTDRCTETFGPDCTVFKLENPRWDNTHDWSALEAFLAPVLNFKMESITGPD